jgi:uncharacterized protein (DUF4415 family)
MSAGAVATARCEDIGDRWWSQAGRTPIAANGEIYFAVEDLGLLLKTSVGSANASQMIRKMRCDWDMIQHHPEEIDMPPNRTRRPVDARDAAEAAFKAVTTKPVEVAAAPKNPPPIPNAKELVSLRIDQDILAHFQDDGPGWQDRINAALRKAAGL